MTFCAVKKMNTIVTLESFDAKMKVPVKVKRNNPMCFNAKLLQVLAELFLLGVGGFVAHGPEITSISRVVFWGGQKYEH